MNKLSDKQYKQIINMCRLRINIIHKVLNKVLIFSPKIISLYKNEVFILKDLIRSCKRELNE